MTKVDSVLRGIFPKLDNSALNQSKRQLKILLVSGDSDFIDERDVIWFETLPEVQACAAHFGAELVLIDTLQGIPDIASLHADNPVASSHTNHLNVLRRELEQDDDVIFVCLLGDTYGKTPLPETLSEDYYQAANSCFVGRDGRCFEDWYQLDNNAQPRVYRLQSLRKAKKALDSKAYSEAIEALTNASKTNSVKAPLLTSWLEQICSLVSANKQLRARSLVVLRQFQGINESHLNQLLKRNPELSQLYDVDSSCRNKLKKLKAKLSSSFDPKSVLSFDVPYDGSVTWRSGRDQMGYMEKFTPCITHRLKNLVSTRLEAHVACSFPMLMRERVREEAMTHLKIFQSHRKKLSGVDEWLRSLEKSLKGIAQEGGVFVIRGQDGSGKTALLADIAHRIHALFPGDSKGGPVLMVRACGCSPSSNTAHELVVSICQQMQTVYNLDVPSASVPQRPGVSEYAPLNGDDLCDWFASSIKRVAVSSNAPLFILIDDLHILKQSSGTFSNLKWLSNSIPTNVAVVLTLNSVTDLGLIIPGQKQIDSKRLFDVPKLSQRVLTDISKDLMLAKGRSVTNEQSTIISQCIKSESIPLFTCLLSFEALSWTTPSVPNGAGLPQNCAAMLEYLFVSLEKRYSTEVISRLCGYIECSQFGITECELLDVLSCNRDVMAALTAPYRGTNPDGRLLRFPSAVWLHVKIDMEALLERVHLDGFDVLRWRHACIGTAVRLRYMQASLLRKRLHTNLSDLYANTHVDAGESQAPAFHAVQPRLVRVSGIDRVDYNLRRIREQWYQLLNSGDVDRFKAEAICNFDYVEALLFTTGLPHLQSLLEVVLFQVLNGDFLILYHSILSHARSAIAMDPLTFAGEVIGRLRYMKDTNSLFLNGLVEHAMTWVDNYSLSPLLVPLTCWIEPNFASRVCSVKVANWSNSAPSVVLPTINYQHILYAGEKSGDIRMYHVASQTLVRTLSGHSQRVNCMVLSTDGQFFVSGCEDGSVKCWDLIHADCKLTASFHTARVYCMAITSDGKRLVTGSKDGTVKVTTVEQGQCLATLKDQNAVALDLVLTDDDEVLITGSDDFNVRVWSMLNYQLVNTMGGLVAPITSVSLSSNNTFLLAACADESLHVFALCSGAVLHQLTEHDSKVYSLCVALDDCQAFVGSADGVIYCYDLHTKELLEKRTVENKKPVTALRNSKDGNFLFAASGDLITVWSVRKRNCTTRPNSATSAAPLPHKSAKDVRIVCVALSRDTKYAATGNLTGQVECWDLEACQCSWRSYHEPAQSVTKLAFNNDCDLVISGTDAGIVTVWLANNGKLMRHYNNHHAAIKNIQLFHDNVRVLTHDVDDCVHIWPLIDPSQPVLPVPAADESLLQPVTFKGPRGAVHLISDKDIIGLAPDSEKEARIWSINTDSVSIRGRFTHVDAITCTATSVDGKIAVTGSKDQSLKVWEVPTGFLTQVLVGHSETVTCCAVTANSKMVLSGSEDKLIFCWSIDTGAPLHQFTMHSATVTALTATLDSSIFFSVSEDGWVFCYNAESGAYLTSLCAYQPIAHAVCSADGGRVLLNLKNSPHCPILCLHNSPAGFGYNFSRKNRNSVSSTGSIHSYHAVSPPQTTTLGSERSSSGSLPAAKSRKDSRYLAVDNGARESEVVSKKKKVHVEADPTSTGGEKSTVFGRLKQLKRSTRAEAVVFDGVSQIPSSTNGGSPPAGAAEPGPGGEGTAGEKGGAGVEAKKKSTYEKPEIDVKGTPYENKSRICTVM